MEALRIIQEEHQSLAAILHAVRFMLKEIKAGKLDARFRAVQGHGPLSGCLSEKRHHPKEDDFLFARLKRRTDEGPMRWRASSTTTRAAKAASRCWRRRCCATSAATQTGSRPPQGIRRLCRFLSQPHDPRGARDPAAGAQAPSPQPTGPRSTRPSSPSRIRCRAPRARIFARSFAPGRPRRRRSGSAADPTRE